MIQVWLSSSQPSGRPGSVKLVCQLDDQVPFVYVSVFVFAFVFVFVFVLVFVFVWYVRWFLYQSIWPHRKTVDDVKLFAGPSSCAHHWGHPSLQLSFAGEITSSIGPNMFENLENLLSRRSTRQVPPTTWPHHSSLAWRRLSGLIIMIYDVYRQQVVDLHK